ncbi:filamin-A-like isoform X4 [Rhopilema esculentum]|uniref:filamin-A-like isoform X4 n=1 Tax=Rhopilema esculentum TaxID=499914 RepID=UPI0031D75B54
MDEMHENAMAVEDPTSTDAAWKKIQQNTFTRWCNEHLKCVNLFIYNLESDFNDGLKLVSLLQVLSHKRINRYNKKPTFRPQKLENIAIALKFIDDEDIKLVNIDASDIYKGNLKLILGLIWTLILKYQISMPMLDTDDEQGKTPKQALMGWVKSKLPPEVKCDNFAKDWNDGIALASLVDATAPGLFPEWEDLNPANKLDNARDAMKRAEDWLGIPQVITPEEITNPNVDELSVMTYVSYFPEAKVKPGAPIKQKMTDASKCRAWGPGIESEGVIANQAADFFVEATGSSKGKVNVSVLGPGRKQIDCEIIDNHDNTYSCRYVAPKPGIYDVHIRIGGHHIPDSPFRVNVSSDVDATKVYARGPGLEPTGVIVNRPAKFEVVTSGAGHGNVHVDIIDPKGNKKTELQIEDQGNGIFACQYLPSVVGKYVICIKFGDSEIAKSPFRVQVEKAATRVNIYGPGLEPGLKTGKPATFTVDCKEVGVGNLDIEIEGPGRGDVSCDVEDNGDGTFTCTYRPMKPGTYIVKVRYDQEPVPKSPVKVTITSSADLSKIKAWGPGLEGGVEGMPAEFYVEAKGTKLDSLTFAVEGPGKAPVEVEETGPSKLTIRYFPEEKGEYVIHVMCEEIDIPTSPFRVKIVAKGDASKVYADGPGLKPGCMTGRPAEFTVFTHKAGGAGKVEVICTDEDGTPVEVKMKDNRDGTYSVSYMPVKPGTYTVTIKFAAANIPKSPYQVLIKPYCDPTKVKVTGAGLKGGKANKPANFEIDASKAGEGGIGLTIEGPVEADIKCDDHGNGTCSVEYLPVEDGEYTINVLFADVHVPGSPFKAIVSSDFDASKVKATGPGLEPGCKAGRRLPITVDSRKAGKAALNVVVTDEVGNPVDVEMNELEPGLHEVFYSPKSPGEHTITVTFGGKPIPKSPFKVKIEPAADASKVKVSGPGIKPTGIRAEEPTYIEIDASEAGEGNVDVSIEPDSRRMPKVDDIEVKEGDKPNTYIVTYVPPKKGKYTITIKFGGDDVPKSPFKIDVEPGIDVSQCKVYGPGLEEVIVGQESSFTAECPEEAGPGKLSVTIENPDGSQTDVLVKEGKKGVFTISWTASMIGKHKVVVKFGGKEVPGSPFAVSALMKGDASKVKLSGPGLEKAIVDKPNEFVINTKNAGAGNLGLAIEGPAEAKITCKDNGDGTCTVSYIPVEPGDHEINVRFADEHVPGSPFVVPAYLPVDASKVKCSGDGLKKNVDASFPQEFIIDASKAGDAPLEVEITGPDRKPRKPEITDNKDGTYKVKYVPDVEGRYTIGVKYGGDTVAQSPFRVQANPTGDASKCKVSGPGVKNPSVGKPAKFEVDATKAGKGNVTPKVRNPVGDEIPCEVKEVDDNVYACSWTPEEPGDHLVDVNFGGRPVNGSPFKAKAIDGPDTSPINTDDLASQLADEPVVDLPVESVLDCSELEPGKLEGLVTTPSGKKDKVKVSDNGDGTYDIEYTPKELGVYTLDVTYENVPVPGSPFKFKVVKPGPRKVKVHGPGLKKGYVNKPNAFIIDTKGAGPGELSLAVEGPSKADFECIDNGDGTCTATYIPKEPGTYDIFISFANESIPDAPIKVQVVEEEPMLEVGKEAELNMAPDDVRVPSDLPSLSGVLSSPRKDTPIDLKEGPNKTLSANFTPVEAGRNDLHLKKKGKELPGCPVPLLVRDKPEIGKPCKIPFELPDVDRKKDINKLKGSLIRPNGKKEPLDVDVTPEGDISVTFTPNEAGKHIINIKKNKKHVEESPYVIIVPGEELAPTALVGSPCDVNLDLPDVVLPDDLKDLKATVERPNGEEEPCEMSVNKDKTLAVSFTPREPGLHLIHIKKKRRPVKGSPFKVMVEQAPKPVKNPTVGNPCDVNFSLPDVNLPEDFEHLTAELERPTGATEPVDLKLNPDNSLSVSFVPTEPGMHLIHIKKRRRPIKDSPIKIMVDEAPEAEKAPTVGNPCDVNLELPDIVLPDDLSEITAILERPTLMREKVPVKANPDNTLAVSFVPQEAGLHQIHIKKSRKPVKGSPFKVMVEEAVPAEKQPTVGNPCDVNLELPSLKLPDDLKKLKATLTRPNGKKEPLELTANPDNTLGMHFIPEQPGKHIIEILKDRRPVEGSPIEIMVVEEEPSKKEPTVGDECALDLDIPGLDLPGDLSRLSATLKRPSKTKEEPIDIEVTPEKTISVKFVPTEPGEHLISIKKDRKHVQGSPFSVNVVGAPISEDIVPETEQVAESAADFPDFPDYPEEQTKPAVGAPHNSNFKVPGIKLPDDLPYLTAVLDRPNGDKEPLDVKQGPDETIAVSFTPKESGEHLLHIKKNRREVSGSPFVIIVEGMEPKKSPAVGTPCDVNLVLPDISLPNDLPYLKAKLTRPNGKTEPLNLSVGPDNSLSMNFTPTETGKHVIDITKNGKPIKQSPIIILVEEEERPKVPTVGNVCDVNLDIEGIQLPRDLKHLSATLKRPSGKEEPMEVRCNDDNTLNLSFTPTEPGDHYVYVKKDGKNVNGSPFLIAVEMSEEPERAPTVGSPCDVAVELPDLRIPEDLKFLKCTLERPNGNTEPLEPKAGPDNTLSVNFVPEEPGKHLINIKKDRRHVKGSPIEVMVKDAKPRKPGQPCAIGLEIPGIRIPEDLRYLKATVTSPSGKEEPAELKAGPNNRTIVVSFMPKEVGKHLLNIKKRGEHVQNSPYEVIVKPEDLPVTKPDASKVKVRGDGLKGGPVNTRLDFLVDTRDAGYGGLGLSVEGPSKVEINCVDNEDGTCTVDFTPDEAGTYNINVTYADEHIPGSPFKCVVTGDKGRRRRPVEEDISAVEQGVEESAPDSYSDILAFPSTKAPQDFVIKFSGTGELNATVTRPSGVEDPADVMEAGRDQYTIRFIPRETGEHKVNVKHRGRHIPGSPFKVYVDAPSGGAKACKAFGLGLTKAVAGEPCKFTVNTKDAGPGGLAVAVEGPAKADIQCHDNGDGTCDITWYPVEPGEYTVHIRFADEPIPDSPFTVNVVAPGEGAAMSMAKFKEQVLRVGQQASFAVRMKGKDGKLTASVQSPSGAELECSVVEIEKDNFAVRFVPKELGEHRVNVFLDGHHIPGSPFKVRVGGIDGDPSKVRAYGPGLRAGVVNLEAEFTVNALDAGSGALALSIDGPAKVKMNCMEQDDGTYKVTYRPTIAGSYEISIRFAGQHIPGSAYKVIIAASEDAIDAANIPDASKCTSRGDGLKRAYINEVASFTVNASQAGRGAIMVGVEGPVIPARQIFVKHTGGGVYSVEYILEEKGDYVLRVLWGGFDIPGSPFHIKV